MKWFFCTMAALAVSASSVYAYIGPGTGSIVANTLWPLIVTVGSVIIIFSSKYIWNPIKNVFSKLKRLGKRD